VGPAYREEGGSSYDQIAAEAVGAGWFPGRDPREIDAGEIVEAMLSNTPHPDVAEGPPSPMSVALQQYADQGVLDETESAELPERVLGKLEELRSSEDPAVLAMGVDVELALRDMVRGMTTLEELLAQPELVEAQWRSNLRATEWVAREVEGWEPPSLGDVPFSLGGAPVWYSGLRRAVGGAPEKNTGGQLAAWLKKKPGVKQEEIEWTGLDKFLAGKKKVTRDEVLAFLAENEVAVREMVLGGRPEVGITEVSLEDLEREAAYTPSPEADGGWIVRPRNAQAGALSAIIERRGSEAAFDADRSVELAPITAPGEAPAELVESAVAWLESELIGGPRHEEYTLPGGENYRELLLTLPAHYDAQADRDRVERWRRVESPGTPYGDLSLMVLRERKAPDDVYKAFERSMFPATRDAKAGADFTGGHYGDVAPNVLAHTRVNDRTDSEGRRVLFVEEIQSDWMQRGREKGFLPRAPEPPPRTYYKPSEIIVQERDLDWIISTTDGRGSAVGKGVVSNEEAARWYALAFFTDQANREAAEEMEKRRHGVPDAPYKQTASWVRLVLKRLIRLAADEGYDAIAWTTGEQQRVRYKKAFADAVDSLTVEPRATTRDTPKYMFSAVKDGTVVHEHDGADFDDLRDLIGKKLATEAKERIEAGADRVKWNTKDKNFDVGGHGYRVFYDQLVRNEASKLGKKYGAKVGGVRVDVRPEFTEEDAALLEALEAPKLPPGPPRPPQPALFLTDQLTAAARQGMPLFSLGQAPIWNAQGEPSQEYRARFAHGSRRALLDRLLGTKVREEKIVAKELGVSREGLPDTHALTRAEELRRSQSQDIIDLEVDERHQIPIVAAMKRAKITLPEVGDWLYARHAPERNKAIRKIDPSNYAGSGMTDAEARAITEAWESDRRLPAMQEIAAHVDALNVERLDRLEESGSIHPDERRAWEAAYKFYVPLRTAKDEPGMIGSGKGLDVRGPESRRALGRRSRADNPLVFAFSQAGMSVVRAKKREVDAILLRLFEEFPIFGDIDVPDYKKALGPDGFVRMVVDPSWTREPGVLGVKRGGRLHLLKFRPEHEEMARELKMLDMYTAGTMLQLAQRYTRFLAEMSTSRNPVFFAPNAIRDIGTAFFIAAGERGLDHAVQIVRNVPKAYRGWVLWQRHKTDEAYWAGTPDKWAKTVKRYHAAGGRMAVLGLDSFDKATKKLEKGLVDVDPAAKLKFIRKSGRWLFDHIDTLNTIAENGSRVAAFDAGLRSGMTDAQAALYAKEITTNFEKKGNLGPLIHALWAFANAALHGTERVAYALTKPGTWKYVGGIVASSAMLASINRLLFPDEWEATPDYIKRNNIMIPNLLRAAGGDSGPTFFMIPSPFTFNFAGAVGVAGEQAANSGKPLGESVRMVWDAFFDMANPLGGGDQPLYSLIPTGARPFHELDRNQNWAGRPIMPHKYNDDVPDAETYWPDVNPAARRAAAFLAKVSGGNEGKKGFLDFSPESLEHMTFAILGGLGRTIDRAVGITGTALGGEIPELRNVPLARRFAYSIDEARVGQVEFRRAEDEIGAIHTEVTRLRAAGKNEEATAARKAGGALYGLRGRLLAARRNMKKLREQIETAKDDDERRRALQSRYDTIQADFAKRAQAARSRSR
jgi:hypothetical protein